MRFDSHGFDVVRRSVSGMSIPIPMAVHDEPDRCDLRRSW
jgi:hypothetical protein